MYATVLTRFVLRFRDGLAYNVGRRRSYASSEVPRKRGRLGQTVETKPSFYWLKLGWLEPQQPLNAEGNLPFTRQHLFFS